MSWKDNINTIKEIYPGQFQIILDFATNKFIEFAISDHYKYISVVNYSPQKTLSWEQLHLPLSENGENIKLLARSLHFDFVLDTNEFMKVLPTLRSGINMIQLNKLPKYYLNLNGMHRKTFYDLLTEECDYLFHLDIPSATDYGTIVSSNKGYLQNLLDNPNLDWTNLS